MVEAKEMKLIIGLGNPGSLYDKTRHNIGKMFIGYLAQKYSMGQHRVSAKFVSYVRGKTVFVTSEVFMNLSVQSVEAVMKMYPGITLESTMVVLDDLDHKLGNARVKKTGSAEYQTNNIGVIEGHCLL